MRKTAVGLVLLMLAVASLLNHSICFWHRKTLTVSEPKFIPELLEACLQLPKQ